MAIASKGRRRIVVAGRSYYWRRRSRDPKHPTLAASPVISVFSEDRRFYVRYHLFQGSERRYLTVLGPEMGGGEGRGLRRYRCPEFGWIASPTVLPGTIREIVDWCQRDIRRAPVDVYGLALAQR